MATQNVSKSTKGKFADWLSEEMRKAGLGVTEVARQVGVQHPTVIRWLSGTVPSSGSCIKLARFFGVPEDYVLELAGHKTMATEEPDIADPELRAYANQLGRLDPHDAEIIKAQLRVMLGRGEKRRRERKSKGAS